MADGFLKPLSLTKANMKNLALRQQASGPTVYLLIMPTYSITWYAISRQAHLPHPTSRYGNNLP